MYMVGKKLKIANKIDDSALLSQTVIPPAPPAPPATSQPSTLLAVKVKTAPPKQKHHRKDLDALANQILDMEAEIECLNELILMLKNAKNAEPQSPEAKQRYAILSGKVDTKLQTTSKIVRIFTSSTFTDTKHERNMLMKNAYPRIKDHCRRIGYEFQVVDMRWGVRDEATDDHMGTELCLKELELCRQVSTGPYFVSLLSHKYGYTPFPRMIEAKEFEQLLSAVDDNDANDLLHKWYTRDENDVPTSYILASISQHYPDIVGDDPDRQKAAKNSWWQVSSQMQDALEASANRVFDKDTVRKYTMSITENETHEGLLKHKGAEERSIWLKRNIDDIEKQDSSRTLSRYTECLGPEKKWKKSREMLRELKDDHMLKKLGPDRVLNYNVKWTSEGIDPDTSSEHKTYLDKMCSDFVDSMTKMVDESVSKNKLTEYPLMEECCQHIRFCQSKYENFHGREEILAAMRKYVESPNNTEPFVLHGSSGTGKTSIMAMAAKQAYDWTHCTPLVVIRFLGTSPASSSLMSLLYSITSQIRKAYNLPNFPPPEKIQVQISNFEKSVINSKQNKPLIIMLDSLDQLDPTYDALKIGWLKFKFPPWVKMIVSTLPEPKYECFQSLQGFVKNQDNFLEVPVMPDDDVKIILEKWLSGRNRQLTTTQMEFVITAFQKCPTPLFLKLSFEEAVTWTSFVPDDRMVLQETVRVSIDHLFKKLEKIHGQILVSRALAYMTLAKIGATEAELEDILSCDDDVLNDVYMYWTPPIRRLPPLLLIRIRTDLGQYLVERGADGVRVMYWYHRQFIEAAEARYCSDVDHNKIIHSNLADFFNGTWANGKKKPFVSGKGIVGEEDRHVSQQPYTYGDKLYNLRAMNNTPYHRLKAGQVELLKEQCLTNIDFLRHKLKAVPLINVLEDFVKAKQAFLEDELISTILDALRLSPKGLMTDSAQLVPQLIGRMQDNEVTSDFLKRCQSHPNTYLQPYKRILEQPGGQLVHCIAAHKDDVDMMDLTTDGKYAVTVCQSLKEITVWDIEKAQKLRDSFRLGQCTKAVYCNNDMWVACENYNKIICMDHLTGRQALEIALVAKSNLSFCVGGKNNHLVLAFIKNVCYIYDLMNEGKLVKPVVHLEQIKFGNMSIPIASSNYAVVCDEYHYNLTILDLRTRQFGSKIRAFPITYDEDGDEEEHEAGALAIHPDETFFAYTTMFTSEIVLLDMQGNKLRTVPPNPDRSFSSLHITPNGSYMYLHDGKDLIIFNAETLEEVDILEHPKDIVDERSIDMNTVVTLADDGNVRIWDRRRPKPISTNTDTKTVELYQIRYASPFDVNNPRLVLVIGRKSKNDENTTIIVYDCIDNEVIRQRDIADIGGNRIRVLLTEDEQTIFLCFNRRIYRFNWQTMTIELRFQGFTETNPSESAIIYSSRKQILCKSKGDTHLKVYDAQTGQVVAILKSDQEKKIESISVNLKGTVACANTDEGPLLVYDLEEMKYLYAIHRDKKYGECFAYNHYINPSGTIVAFSVDIPIVGAKNDTDITQFILWNIKEAKEVGRMCDMEKQTEHDARETGFENTSIDELYPLDDDRYIATCCDNILRVYNSNTGELLQRLEGHTSSTLLAVNKNSPYILSYGYMTEEDCLRLWDKQTYQCVSSYSLDKTINKIYWSTDGRYIVTTDSHYGSMDILRWSIKYGQDHVSIVPEEYYKPKKLTPEFHATDIQVEMRDKEVPFVPEDDDPDTDPEVVESDDDEDDDDDDKEAPFVPEYDDPDTDPEVVENDDDEDDDDDDKEAPLVPEDDDPDTDPEVVESDDDEDDDDDDKEAQFVPEDDDLDTDPEVVENDDDEDDDDDDDKEATLVPEDDDPDTDPEVVESDDDEDDDDDYKEAPFVPKDDDPDTDPEVVESDDDEDDDDDDDKEAPFVPEDGDPDIDPEFVESDNDEDDDDDNEEVPFVPEDDDPDTDPEVVESDDDEDDDDDDEEENGDQ